MNRNEESSYSTSRQRQDIEVLRILSAFGIIWFHSMLPVKNIGYSGLVFFTAVAIYLSGPPRSVLSRAYRLIVPWFFWSTFYSLINFIRGRPVINTDFGIVLGILSGPSIHLWFLPFLFITLVVFDLLKGNIPLKIIGQSAGYVTVLLLFTARFWRPYSLNFSAPWAQYIHAFPAVTAGIFYWSKSHIRSNNLRLLSFLFILAAISTIPNYSIAITYSLGLGSLITVVIGADLTHGKLHVTKISSLSFGIYLIHPIVIMLLYLIGFPHGFIFALVVFMMSAIITWIIRLIFPRMSMYIT